MNKITSTNRVIPIATREAANWFARLRADDVSEQDRMHFEEWLEKDTANRKAYAEFERFWSTTGSYARDPMVAKATHSAVAEIPVPRHVYEPTTRKPKQTRFFAIAASICITAVGVATLVFWPYTNSSYQTAIGEQRAISLPDGSRVTLNTDSLIRIHYTDTVRTIQLERGQAYFRVAKEHRPFAVETKNRIVYAIGTAFDVYQDKADVVVTVAEGTVLVTDPGALTNAKPAESSGKFVRASQRLLLANGHPVTSTTVETAPMDRSIAWLSGKLVFNDEGLIQAVAEVNRYSKRHIVIGDAQLKTLRVSGVFPVGEPAEFVDSMSKYFALYAEPDADGNIVLYPQAKMKSLETSS